MLSKELSDIIAGITEKSTMRDAWLRSAQRDRDIVATHNKNIAEAELKAQGLEADIDQLQLAMRTVLNGLPSPVKVDPPKVLEEQIGRES